MPRKLSLTRDEAESLVDLIDDHGADYCWLPALGEDIRALFGMISRKDQLRLQQEIENEETADKNDRKS